jgi:hypothetical protein
VKNHPRNWLYKKIHFHIVDWKLILQQIEAKAKAKEKLPHWFSREKLFIPQKFQLNKLHQKKPHL